MDLPEIMRNITIPLLCSDNSDRRSIFRAIIKWKKTRPIWYQTGRNFRSGQQETQTSINSKLGFIKYDI